MAVLFLFSDDLRIHDNAALNAAVKTAQHDQRPLLMLYIRAPDTTVNNHQPFAQAIGASAWWLHHSLDALQKKLATLGQSLHLFEGDHANIIDDILTKIDIHQVYFSRSYQPLMQAAQKKIHQSCKTKNIPCKRYSGTLLIEPEDIRTGQGHPFKVFTPFYKQYLARQSFIKTEPYTLAEQLRNTPGKINLPHSLTHRPLALQNLQLTPKHPDWAQGFHQYWQPGEEGAHKRLRNCTEAMLTNYHQQRDFPALNGTSALSAHLRFGEISPSHIWHDLSRRFEPEIAAPLLRQLVWRDFHQHLLFHRPKLLTQPFNDRFVNYPWHQTSPYLYAWQHGQTGYPIVDAAMQQLWQTGWMHNRLRMVVASFLCKHLNIHWHSGADWFWQTLLDADQANNIGNWQWVAGCGADAAPFFRIFNPILQSQKFDADGAFIRTWLPQLSKLNNTLIHTPWLASEQQLTEAGITMGSNYWPPIVNHANARQQALERYKNIS